MTRWEDLAVSDTDTETTLCDCSGERTTQACGEIANDSDFLGLYVVTFAADHASHPPAIAPHVGNWPDVGSTDARRGMQVQRNAQGCTLLDRGDEQVSGIRTFTPLGRDDVPGPPFTSEMWTLVDAINMKDSRLQERNTP